MQQVDTAAPLDQAQASWSPLVGCIPGTFHPTKPKLLSWGRLYMNEKGLNLYTWTVDVLTPDPVAFLCIYLHLPCFSLDSSEATMLPSSLPLNRDTTCIPFPINLHVFPLKSITCHIVCQVGRPQNFEKHSKSNSNGDTNDIVTERNI